MIVDLGAVYREGAKVDEIVAYIHSQPYDRWHWIVECVDRAEIVSLLRANGGSPKRVKRILRDQTDALNERARECAFE